MIVVDASVLIAALSPDEQFREEEMILARIADDGAIAPALLVYELANVVMVKVRRKVFLPSEMTTIMEAVRQFDIEFEQMDMQRMAEDVMPLASRCALTAYDAAYLELAKRRQLPLATLDTRLREAAAAEGVALMPLSA